MDFIQVNKGAKQALAMSEPHTMIRQPPQDVSKRYGHHGERGGEVGRSAVAQRHQGETWSRHSLYTESLCSASCTNRLDVVKTRSVQQRSAKKLLSWEDFA